jgi:hypothetical protein
MLYFSLFDVVWVRVKRDMKNGVKQVLPDQRYFQKNAPWQQQQRKNDQTNFFDSISTSTLQNKLKDSNF